jgi:caprin-1
VLTEDNLSQLDELYKLISPSRDADTDYCEQLNAASGHLVDLLEARDKEVGTTGG